MFQKEDIQEIHFLAITQIGCSWRLYCRRNSQNDVGTLTLWRRHRSNPSHNSFSVCSFCRCTLLMHITLRSVLEQQESMHFEMYMWLLTTIPGKTKRYEEEESPNFRQL